MIAVDTSTWTSQVLMVPAVLTEVLSDPKLSSEVSKTLSELPLIEVKRGDALIAQDRGIPLLTRDRDFRAFAEAAGVDLVIAFAAN